MPRHLYLIICLLLPLISWSDELSEAAMAQETKVKALSVEELAGQLIIARYDSMPAALGLIRTHHVGGFILPEGDPYELRSLIAELKAASTLPLWIGVETADGLHP